MKIIKKNVFPSGKVDVEICKCVGKSKCLVSEREHIIFSNLKKLNEFLKKCVLKKNKN